jgi:hypothetical protein
MPFKKNFSTTTLGAVFFGAVFLLQCFGAFLFLYAIILFFIFGNYIIITTFFYAISITINYFLYAIFNR